MKKKIALLAAALCLSMSVPAYAEQIEEITDNTATAAPAQNTAPLFDITGKYDHSRYTGYAIKQDYNGNDCLVIYYDTTNTDSKTTVPSRSTYIQAFQHGTELEHSFITDDEGCNNSVKSIQSGTTINIGKAFKLVDRSDVDIEVEDVWNWTDNTTQKATIKLQ